jgi:predicted transglutaminase-like protease
MTLSKFASIANDVSKKELENQYLRENIMASLNSYILKNGINDPNNQKNYANYLLSFALEYGNEMDLTKEVPA